MMAKGRGRWAVSQKPIMIRSFLQVVVVVVAAVVGGGGGGGADESRGKDLIFAGHYQQPA